MVIAKSGLMAMFIRLMAVARYRFIVELTGIFLVVWLGCALMVYIFEHGHSPRIHDLSDATYGLLVTMTTSGDSAVQPATSGGRWVVGFALILSKLLTALLCALAAAVLIERKVKEEMGLKMHKLSQHLVILGWNLKGPAIVQSLRREAQYAHAPILVVADLEHKPSDDPLLWFTRSPYPIRGEAIDKSCLGSAATVVVLANYAEKHNADALTAVSVLLARRVNPKARIIAELLDPGQRAYLEAAGADLVVGIGEVGGYLLAEAAMGHEVVRQLLTAVSDTREQRSLPDTDASTTKPSPTAPAHTPPLHA
jgi:voltage-gated potassium channel